MGDLQNDRAGPEASRLQRELAELREDVDSLRDQVRKLADTDRAQARALKSHEIKIGRLRLDRQLTAVPRWLASRVRRQLNKQRRFKPRQGHLLVLAPKYPSEAAPYGGQPLERRLLLYGKRGYASTVLVPSAGTATEEVKDGVTVVRAPLSALGELIGSRRPTHLLVHHPLPDLWAAAKEHLGKLPVLLWIHGYEARSWRDSMYNFSEEEIEEKREWLDSIDADRRTSLSQAFAEERATKVFVSAYMKRLAEDFVGVEAKNALVIHNVIDTKLFRYRQRSAEERTRILSVRAYATRKYGTDLTRDTVLRLAKEPWFSELEIEIRGDGRHWEEDTVDLADLENVTVVRGIVDGPELAELMHAHGIMLLPTRWDSQGMTMGEAMSAGMVVVTNRISAIPEFADEETVVMADDEDVEGMVEGLEHLYRNPEVFVAMSEAAASRARDQCGPQATIDEEIALFQAVAAG